MMMMMCRGGDGDESSSIRSNNRKGLRFGHCNNENDHNDNCRKQEGEGLHNIILLHRSVIRIEL